MTTGEKLALLRKKKGMTQEELAEALQVSRQSVSRWEMDAAFPEAYLDENEMYLVIYRLVIDDISIT